MSGFAPGIRLATAATAVATAPFTAAPAVASFEGSFGFGSVRVLRVAVARAAVFRRATGPFDAFRAVCRAVRVGFVDCFLDARFATPSPLAPASSAQSAPRRTANRRPGSDWGQTRVRLGFEPSLTPV